MNPQSAVFLKEIQRALHDAGAMPKIDALPPFPWDGLIERLEIILQTKGLQLQLNKSEVRSPKNFATGLGSHPIAIPFELTPLQGQGYWVMGKEDVSKLSSLTLLPTHEMKGFSSPKFQEGFYAFIATQAALVIDDIQALSPLSIKIGKPAGLPQEEALCLEIQIQHPKQTFWGRLLLPLPFAEEIKSHLSSMTPRALDAVSSQGITVPLELEIGSSFLTAEAWDQTKPGDFILLDRCSFDPETLKGTAIVALFGTPLLRARFKEHHIKIVDYAPTTAPIAAATYADEEESPEAEESALEELNQEEKHLWENPEDTPTTSLATLTVQADQIPFPLSQLITLSPGETFDAAIHPEQGVDVLFQGKKAGRAELMKLGDLIGVRLLKKEG